MPTILKQISINVVEEIPSEVTIVNNINTKLSYNVTYVKMGNLVKLLQNFNQSHSVTNIKENNTIGFKNENQFTLIQINY